MSDPEFTDKPTAPTAQGASGSGSERPLTRGKWTFYGDGLIEYEYTPRIGKVQRVCGILGKDKAETIKIVKKGLPELVEVDEERFDFEIYNHRGVWVRVMDEAWELLNRDPPLVWVIKIRGLSGERHYVHSPEERDARMDQQKWICFSIIVAIIIAISAVAVVYSFLAIHNML